MGGGSAVGSGLVVVGMEGSDASKDALRWAVRYAANTAFTMLGARSSSSAMPVTRS